MTGLMEYFVKYHNKLLAALWEHVEIVLITLGISLVLAGLLTAVAMLKDAAAGILISVFSAVYSIPSLALFALLIPLTGLGRKTAILVLTLYNQYLLLRNFIDGLNQVDPAVVEAAAGMGMSRMQILWKVRLPLSLKPLFAGVRLAVVSTIGIATIAAAINAGGLGSILLDGLRTFHVNKIIWGSILSAGLAVVTNGILSLAEKVLFRTK
ncbi:ABC transporter permease [Anaerolentibacter hominis]|uniref:ABC transporter permease n=1 Tax=Anaerolentibacter hominis TaxID=3079009 RepID=UPI0031B83F1E